MFIPLPILAGVGLLILVLIVGIARSGRRRDPLLGGTPPVQHRAKPVPAATMPAEVEQQVRALVAAGRKIEAIKLAREVTHLGLKDSKELVEAMGRQANP